MVIKMEPVLEDLTVKALCFKRTKTLPYLWTTYDVETTQQSRHDITNVNPPSLLNKP